MSATERLPFWSDNFDADLLKVFPDLEERLGAAATIRLFTHGRPHANGRLNHPCVWNGMLGMIAFFGFDSPAKPADYYTTEPIICCTFLEALRDGWVHDFTMLVEGQVVFDGSSLCREFMPIMRHIRRWEVLSDEELNAKKGRAFRTIDLAVLQLKTLAARATTGPVAP